MVNAFLPKSSPWCMADAMAKALCDKDKGEYVLIHRLHLGSKFGGTVKKIRTSFTEHKCPNGLNDRNTRKKINSCKMAENIS